MEVFGKIHFTFSRKNCGCRDRARGGVYGRPGINGRDSPKSFLYSLLPPCARFLVSSSAAENVLTSPNSVRYLVAVTSDVYKVSYMLDRLLPLVSPRDSVVLIHIVDESAEDLVAGETVDADEVKQGHEGDHPPPRAPRNKRKRQPVKPHRRGGPTYEACGRNLGDETKRRWCLD